ncbi:HoxN/HupN/NixA family nickel/cobalt transporter [Microcoleus vaginatus]|uniref:HoxN/HupN/NixA family nickel/cobalt transporter n=1 Tax=Microcoleus vaginatus TaxID=119532 RepID=UPI001684B248|nr:sulfite exporter TauE/SafE family protein [Microcoleus sp. FACHB-84]MBD2008701.1 sulfite exporter TauE/SafE family protein [Microcoleus sp. FACHB-45]
MQYKINRIPQLFILFFLTLALLLTTSTRPVYSHWSDLSVAEIVVNDLQTEVTLTFPTGLTNFADDNRDSQLQPAEVRSHQTQLEKFFSQQIRLTNSSNIQGSVAVKPLEIAAKSASVIQQPNTHSTLILDYTWPAPSQDKTPGLPDSISISKPEKLRINYNLFLPEVPTASCQATIVQAGAVKSFVFTPQNRDFLLAGKESIWDSGWSLLLAVAGAFAWGCVHAMSPGHGKTIVGAYLVGSRATPVHALFLAATTTITHTAGVFAVGGITLFASNLIDPEKLDPWLSLISGLLVAVIGFNLLLSKIKTRFVVRTEVLKKIKTKIFNKNWFLRSKVLTAECEEPVNLLSRGSWEREFKPVKPDISHHYHHHGDGRLHSHLPPGADGSAITWKSLLALGISGGLLPCPSALVMLLSASALGNVGLGMTLVVAFSLGLALVLSAIGLILVYAKRNFDKLPKQITAVKFLPAISAMFVMLLGLGITGQAMLKILAANQWVIGNG